MYNNSFAIAAAMIVQARLLLNYPLHEKDVYLQ